MKQLAIIRQNHQSTQQSVWDRPTLRVKTRSTGEIREYADCIEVAEGNLIRAFLPPTNSGASLNLLTSAGPNAVYEVFDWEWRVVEVRVKP